MSWTAMNPTDTSRLDEAHEQAEAALRDLVQQYGPDDAAEALTCALVMSEALDPAAIRNRLDAHLQLSEAFEDGGPETGEDFAEVEF